jgi:general secretion pathway protein M
VTLPGGSSGRLIALALLLLPLALLVRAAVVPAWQAYASQGQRIETAREQLERFQRLAAQLPKMREQAAFLKDQDLLTPFLISASNDALAAAEVQQRLKDIALAQQGRILSTRVLKGTTDGPFERVVVNARLQIPLEGLQTLLYEIETGRPYLFIEDLSVMDRPRRRGRRVQQDSHLETRLTLFGLRRPQSAEATRG